MQPSDREAEQGSEQPSEQPSGQPRGQPPAQPPEQQSAPRRASFLQTLRAVGWGLLGIRKGSGYAEDASRLNPVHIVVAAVLAGVLFVVALILIVRWAVASLS